ncbi:tetratricopeptide repeat protein (macronuclear) [Tetrahymena thermophila SB210]|uniref:Tetratricopeptide repeat protein n=1 Tax=Tetrahymena thermophila (strain SB210) TaxID=312017 RepID=Q22GW2_TETTS|nr:tetratricopeptide repeat protein [Tetrahymena thermophila SB210]EAR84562.2 tetratricopeptide repeat protein [Tetrahymena thermophila SB210]|eukprot:XP_001032225.2 tetratricopeptide repeat protein [Tetrahymena thermophila SB210]
MQVNSQSSGSQMDSVERMPGLKYRDSLEEDSYGNKSISKQSLKNTQNSSSTLNQNEIVSGGDSRFYKYEYEIYQRKNQQQMQQEHQFNHPNQGLQQFDQQQHLEQFLQNCLGQNQQNIHQFNQIDPRRRLFVQNQQNQNIQNYVRHQMGENKEDVGEEQEQNQLDSAEQQHENFDQNKDYQEQEDEEEQEDQYYDQDHTQNDQNENQEHYDQKYNQNYHQNEVDYEKEYEMDDLDENGNNTLGRNVLNQYLQRESNKLMASKQNQQEEQFYDEENIQEDEQNQYIESLVTEKQDGDEDGHDIIEKQQKELEDKKQQHQQQQSEMHQEQQVLLYKDSLSNNQSKNQTPTNSQRSENYNSLKQEKQNEQKQSKNLDMQYQLPVQMSQQLFSTSIKKQQSNIILQQKQDESQKIKETYQSNQSQASSKQAQNQIVIERIKQSPQNDNQSNSYRDSENVYNSQANSMISNQERQYSNNQIQYSDSLNSKESFRSSQNENQNSIRYSHHSQQQQQQQQLQEQIQPLDEVQEQNKDNFIKENHQAKQQVYQIYNAQNQIQNKSKELQNNQQITPIQSMSKRDDHVSNETFQVRNPSNLDENYTYRSKESLDLTKRSTLSNASATQVAQKQLYMLNLLEQKEQLNSERYNMLVQDEEIIEQEDMASSHRTDVRVNSEDYRQLKQLIMSKNPSSSHYQQNEKSNLKLEDNLQFNKQLSTQSQQTPENRQKQLSSITGNNTKELFEYSNSSNKNNQTNNLFDSQPRGAKDCYDSTIKNRLKVDLFKKLTDPTMVGIQQNQSLQQDNNEIKNNQHYASDNFEKNYILNGQQINQQGNQQYDQLNQKSLSYVSQQQQPLNTQKEINKYDFTKKEKDEDIFKTAKEWKQNTNEQNKYFYSEISPIDKGPRYKPQYLTINNYNNNNNSDYEEILKRQQQGSPIINNDNNTNQITFQNNFNFQSISNYKECLDDDQSHRTPTNQNKNHINKQKYNDEYSYQNQDRNQNNYQDNCQIQKTQDLPSQKNEYRYNFIERKQKLQNEQELGQTIENDQTKSEQNYNENSGELSYKTPQLEPVSQAILNRYLRRQQGNENDQFELNNILNEKQNQGQDQIHQMDHHTYNEYNIAKYQRKIANYKPDFIEKLQEYQQMSDKKKRDYEELEIEEQNILQNYIKQKSPVLRQPKENTYMPSNALMKGINLRKINQQMKNQVKKSLSNNNKQMKKSHDFSNANTSMRQVQNNSNYSMYSPQKNYLNSNSQRNDAKIRNEMIMNNLNYSPSSEIDNLNSSSNEKPNANSSYRQIKSQINKNNKQTYHDNNNVKKNLSPNKYEQTSNDACNQCHTCQQHLPNSMSFQNSNSQQSKYKIAHPAQPTFFNFNQDQYQHNQLVNLQMSDVTSPISQIKSITKSPIKLDSLGNSPIKFGSHLNSPFDKSTENYAKSKGFIYDPYKFNGYDYRNIPKKHSGHNKSQSMNLNVTSKSDVHQFNLEEIEKQCVQHIQNQEYELAQSLLTQIESYIYQTFELNHPQRIYINYLNARVQQGLQQSNTAVKYCERGLKEILREELFNDSYLFKYSFTLRQLAQCECKKIKQFQQQKYYLTQMEEQLNICEKEFSNLNIEIARIYSDLNNKFGLHIYRELAKVCQELKEYQNACKYIKIIQSKMNSIDIDLSMSLIDMLILSQLKNEAIEESKKIIKFLRTVETNSVTVKEELLLQCIDNLANLYFEKQEYDQSSDWFEQSLQIKTHLFGQYHQITGVGYFLCGKSHHKQNNSVKAIQRLGTCISILDKHLSLFNLYSANSYLTIAEIAKKDQKIDEAIKNYKLAFERFSGIFGSDHFNCLCILLNIIYLTCNFTQSTTQVQVVFSDIVKNTENKLSLDSVQVLNEMSNILRQHNFIQQSLEGYLIASNILKQLKINNGTKQVDDQQIQQNLFLVYMNLASTYSILQQHEKSIMAYFDALSISQTLHQSQEYEFKIHNFLAQSFKAINKYFEAQKHYQEALNIISTKEGFANEKEELRQLIRQCKKK